MSASQILYSATTTSLNPTSPNDGTAPPEGIHMFENEDFYWNSEGLVACKTHAPEPSSDKWRWEGWSSVCEGERAQYERVYPYRMHCEACLEARRKEADSGWSLGGAVQKRVPEIWTYQRTDEGWRVLDASQVVVCSIPDPQHERERLVTLIAKAPESHAKAAIASRNSNYALHALDFEIGRANVALAELGAGCPAEEEDPYEVGFIANFDHSCEADAFLRSLRARRREIARRLERTR